MFLVKPLPEFTKWLDGLSDEAVRGVIIARIKRLELGLMGDVEASWRGRVGATHPFRRGLAHIFRKAPRSFDCVARRW